MFELFNNCKLCPRNCNVNRNNGELGFCRASNKIKIGGYHLHMWEEPIITGENGSGTIFFSNCNLRCIFCQNYEISSLCKGEEITVERLKDIYLLLQDMKATNINLVTPTHYIPLIRESLVMAKKEGLVIPIVYNTSGYEKIDSLKLLDGLIDIYLPDFKYYSNSYAVYSFAPNYFDVASRAIEEMYRQVGRPIIEDGILKKGVIIRHLVLPGCIEDSKKIMKYLYDKYENNIILSIMAQYTPVRMTKYDNLNRKLTKDEYESVIDYTYDLGFDDFFIQDLESQDESFIPNFKGDKII